MNDIKKVDYHIYSATIVNWLVNIIFILLFQAIAFDGTIKILLTCNSKTPATKHSPWQYPTSGSSKEYALSILYKANCPGPKGDIKYVWFGNVLPKISTQIIQFWMMPCKYTTLNLKVMIKLTFDLENNNSGGAQLIKHLKSLKKKIQWLVQCSFIGEIWGASE